MIKYAVIAAMLGGALALGGCATGGGGGGGVDLFGCGQVSSVADVARCAQKIAKNTCSFVADIDPLIKLVPQFGGDASALANAVCSAVNTQQGLQARRRVTGTSVVVGGVVVTGHYN